MCRWAAYIGAPIFLSDVILAPEHSLVAQSAHAREAKTETNGDGFGIAWYAHRETPALFKDVMPAWGDGNLGALAEHIRSGLFLAHVRASTGTAITRTNCHPFTSGRWSFMHNGQIGGFAAIRQTVEASIRADLYAHRSGTTDSEALFLLALGYGLKHDPKKAFERAITELEALSRCTGEAPHMRASLALSDGKNVFALRYASDAFAPTLYHKATPGGRLIVSEPMDRCPSWSSLPPCSFAHFTAGSAEISPLFARKRERRSIAS